MEPTEIGKFLVFVLYVFVPMKLVIELPGQAKRLANTPSIRNVLSHGWLKRANRIAPYVAKNSVKSRLTMRMKVRLMSPSIFHNHFPKPWQGLGWKPR
jgi:hypothetical protein